MEPIKKERDCKEKYRGSRKKLEKKDFSIDKPGKKMVYLISSKHKLYFGRLAQLVRAPALQAGGHRFESYIAHHVPK